MLAGVRRAVRELGGGEPGSVVLDVGCGSGALLAGWAAAGRRLVGVDLSPAMLAEARRRLGSQARLVRADATTLPFRDGGADLVVAVMLLHTLSPDEGLRALAEMGRVAGEAGRVVVAEHRPGAPGEARSRAAGALGRVVETLAGHGRGVRRLLAAGGVGALAAAAGLEAEASLPAAGGTLEVVRLRRVATVA